jgi:hypothetical protein
MVTSGAKFSSIYGMFGGYGCGTIRWRWSRV